MSFFNVGPWRNIVRAIYNTRFLMLVLGKTEAELFGSVVFEHESLAKQSGSHFEQSMFDAGPWQKRGGGVGTLVYLSRVSMNVYIHIYKYMHNATYIYI